MKRIRDEYFTADPDERIELKTEFKDVQLDMLKTTISHYAKSASKRYELLSEWNPFENISTDWFEPEWMFGIEKFDIAIANPPYIHLEHIKNQSLFYKALNFNTYAARGDIYALFYEKGVELLKKDGFLCYITSNKWMRAAYGESLRQFFVNFTNPIQLIDFAGQQIFDATVDTNILLLSKSKNKLITDAVIVKEKESISNLSVYVKQNSVVMPFNSSNSWTILSPIEQSIKRKIETVGTPLKDWKISINYGIKTGCNEAFIISETKRAELIRKDPKSAEIIRPILRGRDIKRYGYDFADLWLLFIPWHFPLHKDTSIQGSSPKAEEAFEAQYPAIYNHLLQHKTELSNRNKAETGIRYEWYALQRWGANYSEVFVMQETIYNADIYLRLSKEDGDKEESDSIGNQRALILDFLKTQPNIRLHKIRIDDGYSGVDFNRPSFIEMIEDIKAGTVNCVLVKDFSRFGRNYIEAGKYIQVLFPRSGIRFIAVNENYDSTKVRATRAISSFRSKTW